MRNLWTLALACALACAPAAQAGNRAILVGISKYPFAPPTAQLASAAGDAQRIRKLIIDLGWFAPGEITELYNREATADAIGAAIRRTIAETQPGDRVLFYYSGHGTQAKDRDGDEPDGLDEAIVAADYGVQPKNAADRPESGILIDDELGALLDGLAGRDLTVILDSCHSGTATRSAEANPEPDVLPRFIALGDRGATRDRPQTASEPPMIAQATGRTVWSAAAPAQVAWEDRKGGIFTQAFITGLRDRAADTNRNGVITNAELLDYTRARADDWCRKSKSCTERRDGFTPNFEGAPDTALLQNAAQPVTPTVAPGDILGQQNTAGLTLAIDPGPSNPVGTNVRFVVGTQAPGLLVLFDIDPLGRLHQLSPSRLSRPGVERIAPGQIVIPETLSANGKPLRIRVSEPSGQGQLIALLIEDQDVAIDSLLLQNLTAEPVEDAAGLLTALAERMRNMQANDGKNRALVWSVAYLDYEILP